MASPTDGPAHSARGSSSSSAGEGGGVAFEVLERLRAEPDDLEFLDLSGKGLVTVPYEVFRFTNLKGLYLSDNSLAKIPSDLFRNLPALEYLDLRNNRIEQLPDTIGQHQTLRTLLLAQNCLATLPVELANVLTLRSISLARNPLYFPPGEVVEQGLPAVQHFLRARLAGGRVTEPAFVTSPVADVVSADEPHREPAPAASAAAADGESDEDPVLMPSSSNVNVQPKANKRPSRSSKSSSSSSRPCTGRTRSARASSSTTSRSRSAQPERRASQTVDDGSSDDEFDELDRQSDSRPRRVLSAASENYVVPNREVSARSRKSLPSVSSAVSKLTLEG